MKIKKTAYLSAFALISMLMTACGPKNPNSVVSENPADFFEAPTDGEKAFTSVSTFDEPVEFHTADQKAFLEYREKNYEDVTGDEMTTWSKGDNQDVSQPLPIKIEFAQDSAGVEKYTLEISRDYKFINDVIKVDVANTATEAQVYNLFSGTDYYYKVKAIYDDETYAVSATNKLTTASGIRNLNIEGLTNCRDMGGKATVDGGYIKQGLLYRTAALDDDQSGSIIKDAGKVRMLDELKVKTEIELRGSQYGLSTSEAKNRKDSVLGSSVNYQYKGMAYSGGRNLLFRNVELVRKVFDVLGEPDNYPVFFHCRIGTDRTGLVALLVNALCGLDEQSLYQDYLMSNFGKIGKHFGCKGNGEDTVYGYIQEIKTFPGETLQNSAYNFLLTCGIPAQKLDNIINTLTTEGSVTGNDASKVHCATADKFTPFGGAVLTETGKDIRTPDNTVAMKAAGDGVTYAFSTDKAFSCDLYATLMSDNKTSTLDSALIVYVDGQELTNVENTSFATNVLGFDSNLDCWVPAKLASIELEAGDHTIEIEAKTKVGNKGLSVSQFCFSNMSASATISD